MFLVGPGIVLDVLCMTNVNHKGHFSWQMQYFVKFDVNYECTAQCIKHFM